jgi:hypothetical protein
MELFLKVLGLSLLFLSGYITLYRGLYLLGQRKYAKSIDYGVASALSFLIFYFIMRYFVEWQAVKDLVKFLYFCYTVGNVFYAICVLIVDSFIKWKKQEEKSVDKESTGAKGKIKNFLKGQGKKMLYKLVVVGVVIYLVCRYKSLIYGEELVHERIKFLSWTSGLLMVAIINNKFKTIFPKWKESE